MNPEPRIEREDSSRSPWSAEAVLARLGARHEAPPASVPDASPSALRVSEAPAPSGRAPALAPARSSPASHSSEAPSSLVTVPAYASASVPQTDRVVEEIVDRASRAPLELDAAPSPRQRVSRALSVPMLAGTAVFAIAVIIAIVVTALQARPAAQAASELAPSSAAVDGAAAAGSAEGRSSASGGGSPTEAGEKTEASATAGAGSPARVTVHVVGEVAKPGVVEVAHGARLAEAIEAAGGATPAAVLESVNLARRIVDGEQVLVPNAEQAPAMPPATGAAAAGEAAGDSATGPGGAGGASVSAAGGGASALVNLNTADATALETLPRVGPALAQRIIEWRSTHGGFASVDQLLEVSGIGQKTLDGFRDRVTV